MDPRLPYRPTPSSDRFLAVFSPPTSTSSFGDDLYEDDIFSTGDFAQKTSSSSSIKNNPRPFRVTEHSGILLALSDHNNRKPNQPVISRQPTTSSASRIIPSLPKPKAAADLYLSSQSMPVRKFRQSAPMNVPMMRKVKDKNKSSDFDDDEESEMLPPHEMVARGSVDKYGSSTFSVLEGAGRTLKGRDLSLVRNAVWRRTGFID